MYQFKEFIQKHRPQVNLKEVATGEYWLGSRALELKLIDQLTTSDDYLLKASKDCDLYEVTYKRKKSFFEKLGTTTNKLMNNIKTVLNPRSV